MIKHREYCLFLKFGSWYSSKHTEGSLNCRGQEKVAEHRAKMVARLKERKLPDGNMTFTKVTCWMLGAVVSVAAYALYTGMELDWNSWIPHG